MSLYLYSVRIVIKEKDPAACNLLGLYHGLQVGQQAHVLGHVGCQHLEIKANDKMSIGRLKGFFLICVGLLESSIHGVSYPRYLM